MNKNILLVVGITILFLHVAVTQGKEKFFSKNKHNV